MIMLVGNINCTWSNNLPLTKFTVDPERPGSDDVEADGKGRGVGVGDGRCDGDSDGVGDGEGRGRCDGEGDGDGDITEGGGGYTCDGVAAAAADHRALGPSEPFFGGLTLQGRLPATGFSVFELAVRFGRLVSIRNTTRENKHIVSSSENCFRHVEFMTGLVFYLWLLM